LLIASVLVVVRLLCQLVSVYVAARVMAAAQRTLRERLMSAFLHADAATQAQAREGELAQLLGGETHGAATAIATGCNLIASAGSLTMLMGSTFIVDPLAASLVLVVVIGLALAARPLGRRLHRAASTRALADVDLSSELAESVRLSDELRVFGTGETRQRSLNERAATVASAQVRVYFLTTSVTQIYQTVTIGLMVAGLAAVNTFAPDRTVNLGVVVLMLLRSFAYAQQTQNYLHLLEQSTPSLELLEAREAEFLASALEHGSLNVRSISEIGIDAVSYAYSPARMALSNVSFKARTGEAIGIVGPSGAGKSTLAQILLRLRDPSEGRFLIDGVPAAQISDEDWARLVSYVPQDPKLLTNTVTENIRFFRDGGYSVEAAARAAHIHDEIATWAEGYDTEIGSRGNTISGGQRQRICLARALWEGPQLLVLDEATSALDARSEELIQRSLAELRGKTTVMIIAHRPSTLAICDRILVLARGELVAVGRLDELLKTNDFVAHSFGGALTRAPSDRR
jgi:ABC-type multidrug transport system fused ATPase/permease subunit